MFPTGAYAHSLGLEGAVQDDLVCDLESFQTFLEQMVVPGLEKLELVRRIYWSTGSVTDVTKRGPDVDREDQAGTARTGPRG